MSRCRERWNERAGKTLPRAADPCKLPSCNRAFRRKVPTQEFCSKGCRDRYNALAQTRARRIYEPVRDWLTGKGKRRADDPAKMLSAEALTFFTREVASWRDEDAAARESANNIHTGNARSLCDKSYD